MKPLLGLALALFLLVACVPVLHAAEADGSDAPEAPAGLEAGTTPAGAIQLGPFDAPVAMAGPNCADPYYAGTFAFNGQGTVRQACADICAENGDTYHDHFPVGFIYWECYCCPS